MNNKSNRYLFNNNMVLLLESLPSANSLLLGIAIRMGSKNDPPSKSDISHLCEHLLVRACNRQLPAQTVNILDINAFTEREEIYFTIRTAYDCINHLFRWLEVFLKIPEIIWQDMQMEKNVIAQEISSYENSEIEKIDNLFFSYAFKKSALAKPIPGTLYDIQNITLDDVQVYLKTLLHPSNLVISMTGRLDIDETYDHVAKNISAFGEHGMLAPKQVVEQVLFSPGKFKIRSELELIYFVYGFPTIPRSNQDRIGVYPVVA